MNFANDARRALIRFGKAQPFILCFVVCVAYIEVSYALFDENYLYFYDCTIVNTPINFYLAKIVEYDWFVVIVSLMISLAIEVCKWNLYATLFLIVQLIEKSYLTFELEPTYIYIICLANILVAGYLTYKGIRILTNKKNIRTREELIKEYVAKDKEIYRLREESIDILKDIAATFEHKVGEIIKWTEQGGKRRVGGSIYHPEYVDMPDKERIAVLTAIKPSVRTWNDKEPYVFWNLEFKPLKKNGELSQNRVCPHDYEWTGEIYKDFIGKIIDNEKI